MVDTFAKVGDGGFGFRFTKNKQSESKQVLYLL